MLQIEQYCLNPHVFNFSVVPKTLCQCTSLITVVEKLDEISIHSDKIRTVYFDLKYRYEGLRWLTNCSLFSYSLYIVRFLKFTNTV